MSPSGGQWDPHLIVLLQLSHPVTSLTFSIGVTAFNLGGTLRRLRLGRGWIKSQNHGERGQRRI